MRPAWLTSLLTLCLLTASVSAQRPAAATARPATNGGEKPVAPIVEGHGTNVEDADQDALDQAQKKVLDYFANRGMRLQWVPSSEYIKTHLAAKWEHEDAKEPWLGYGLKQQTTLHLVLRDD